MIERDLMYQQKPYSSLPTGKRQAQVFQTGLAVTYQVRGYTIGGIGKKRGGVDQRQIVRGDS